MTIDETPGASTEPGSDELLSDDNLRLPESANILVRLHAVRAWLARRRNETAIEVGEVALSLQEAMSDEFRETRLRRRERQEHESQLLRVQQALAEAQQGLQAYEDAEALLEDCIAHTTSSERVLVEYYLTLEEILQDDVQDGNTPRHEALTDVQHRIERVGAPSEP